MESPDKTSLTGLGSKVLAASLVQLRQMSYWQLPVPLELVTVNEFGSLYLACKCCPKDENRNMKISLAFLDLSLFYPADDCVVEPLERTEHSSSWLALGKILSTCQLVKGHSMLTGNDINDQGWIDNMQVPKLMGSRKSIYELLPFTVLPLQGGKGCLALNSFPTPGQLPEGRSGLAVSLPHCGCTTGNGDRAGQ